MNVKVISCPSVLSAQIAIVPLTVAVGRSLTVMLSVKTISSVHVTAFTTLVEVTVTE